MRFGNPIVHENNTAMLGLTVGIDFDREKYATPKLCTRQKLDEQIAKDKLTRATDLISEECALRLKRARPAAPTT